MDAGCGIGDHTRRIARRGFHCVGIDISKHILARAKTLTEKAGLAERIRYESHSLEALPFEGTFDVVHCRGVLMHIPGWEQALDKLCRCLKPGGSIIIFENNDASLFARTYVLARRLRGARQSRMVRVSGGIEFWSEEGGQPYLVRIANMRALQQRLESLQVRPIRRFATSLWDIEMAPAGMVRNAIIRVNQLAFRLRLPASLCKGNVIIGRRSDAEVAPSAADHRILTVAVRRPAV